MAAGEICRSINKFECMGMPPVTVVLEVFMPGVTETGQILSGHSGPIPHNCLEKHYTFVLL